MHVFPLRFHNRIPAFPLWNRGWGFDALPAARGYHEAIFEVLLAALTKREASK